MRKTIFKVSKMDCPSEENLIRMKLEGQFGIKKLVFDIPNRNITIFHQGNLHLIEQAILDLNLGGKRTSSEDSSLETFEEESKQKSLLWTVLIINFTFFVIEGSTGIISKSMGLIADSLDMLADALVYGLSLFAVGTTAVRKRRVAKIAGYFQITLALIGFIEVLRRFLGFEELPDFLTMIIVSCLALFANALCLYVLQKSKSQESHMKASMIFTSNDIIINLGVILAGVLVDAFNSSMPDLIVGTIVFAIVTQGAFRILRL